MDVFAMVDAQVFADLLSVGALGFVGGVLLPWPFRLVGYVVDVVKVLIR